ncbi:hypothetical protein D3C71_1369020 [compost metagenome]
MADYRNDRNGQRIGRNLHDPCKRGGYRIDGNGVCAHADDKDLGQDFASIEEHLLCGERQPDEHDPLEHGKIDGDNVPELDPQGAVHPEQIEECTEGRQIAGNINGKNHAVNAHMHEVNKDQVKRYIHQIHDQRQHERRPGPADAPHRAADRLHNRNAEVRDTASDQVYACVGHDVRLRRPEQNIQQRTMKHYAEQADDEREQGHGGHGSGGRLGDHGIVAAAFILSYYHSTAGRHCNEHADQKNINRIDHIDRADCRNARRADHGRIDQVKPYYKDLVDQNRNKKRDDLPVIDRFAGEIFVQESLFHVCIWLYQCLHFFSD